MSLIPIMEKKHAKSLPTSVAYEVTNTILYFNQNMFIPKPKQQNYFNRYWEPHMVGTGKSEELV